MATDANRVLPTQVTMAGVDVFTVPVGKKRTITEIAICNVDGSQHTLNLYHLGSGQSASDARAVWKGTPVAANQAVAGARGWIFVANDKLHASADVDNKVNVTVYYIDEDV